MVEAQRTASDVCARIDPRIRRSRQMLFEALESLLREKSIEEITVADIAAQASLNRGTFYDHYPDKFSLLEGLVEAKFQRLLSDRGVHFDGTCAHALIGITLATCDYLVSVPPTGCPQKRVTEKYFESAITSTVRGMILSGLEKHPPSAQVSPRLMAASMAGAIYGAAREWAIGPCHEGAEVVGEAIFVLFQSVLVSQAR